MILFCQSYVGVRWCGHSQRPRIDQLIQYFGVDYDLISNRSAFLARFICEKCGGRTATLHIIPLPRNGHNGGLPETSFYRQAEAPPKPSEQSDELARVEMERMAELMAYNRRIVEAQLAAVKQRRQIEALAEKGVFVIGPPNPWKGRKAMRPRMKPDK